MTRRFCFLRAVAAALLALLLCAYGLCDAAFAVQGALRQERGRALCLLCLPFLFPAVHIVYGTGTVLGLLSPAKEPKHA